MIFVQLTAISALVLIATLIWSLVDSRTLGGFQVWVKPAKFAVSFVIHFATLAIIIAFMSPENAERRVVAIVGWILAAVFVFEMAYIIVQAARAQHSHFNNTTPFHSAMYSLMGIGAIVLIAMPVAVAWLAKSDVYASGYLVGSTSEFCVNLTYCRLPRRSRRTFCRASKRSAASTTLLRLVYWSGRLKACAFFRASCLAGHSHNRAVSRPDRSRHRRLRVCHNCVCRTHAGVIHTSTSRPAAYSNLVNTNSLFTGYLMGCYSHIKMTCELRTQTPRSDIATFELSKQPVANPTTNILSAQIAPYLI